MRRFSRHMALLALCVLSFGGCGLNAQSVAGKSWLRRPKAADERKIPSANAPMRPRLPNNSPRPIPRRDTEEASAEPRTETSRKTAASGSEKPAQFDKETLKLIEEELANTPPAEKEQFYKDVMSLQPAMVRQIIRMRRVVRQVGQDAPQPVCLGRRNERSNGASGAEPHPTRRGGRTRRGKSRRSLGGAQHPNAGDPRPQPGPRSGFGSGRPLEPRNPHERSRLIGRMGQRSRTAPRLRCLSIKSRPNRARTISQATVREPIPTRRWTTGISPIRPAV